MAIGSSDGLRYVALLALVTATCNHNPPSTSPSTLVEPDPDRPCPRARDWLARHPSYNDELPPLVDRARLDSTSLGWMVPPPVEYPPRAIRERWEGRARVIGIVDTLGRFIHADVCGLQVQHPPGDTTRLASPVPDLGLITEWARAIREALPASRVTPLTSGGRRRSFVAIIPLYYRLR